MSDARTLLKSVRFTQGNPVGCSGCTSPDPLLSKVLAYRAGAYHE